jgi:hypothetical protein
MLEGQYSPPFYNDLYDFKDGAQNDIFGDSDAPAPPASTSSQQPVSSSISSFVASATSAASSGACL